MSKANCTYTFNTAAGPVTIQGQANMKAWLAANGEAAIVRERMEPTQTPEFKRWFGDWEVTKANREVNEAIDRWAAGGMKSGEILQLGKPSDVLRQFGVPDLPIHLTQKVLTKAVRQKHDVDVADLKDLAMNIHAPIAVFKSRKGADHVVVVTEARHADGNIIVALELEKTRDGLEVNDISSVHPKRDSSVSQWIEDGLLMGHEKVKGRK